MIQDELSQGAKNAILKAVRDGLSLNSYTASPKIVAELNQSGCCSASYSAGLGNKFVLTSRTIGEIIDILKTVFEVQ